MEISVNIRADHPEELQSILKALAGAPEIPKTAKSTEKKKAKETPPAEEPANEANEKPEPVCDSAPIPTDVELRAIAAEKGKADGGKAAIKALLTKYDSPAISKVPEDRRIEFLAELERYEACGEGTCPIERIRLCDVACLPSKRPA